MTYVLNFTLYDLLPPATAWALVAMAFILCRATAAYQQIRVVYNGEGKSALHETSFLREAPYYVLFYASGLPILFCLGVQQLAALAFQIPLNLRLGGGPFIESNTWDLWGIDVPKPFAGRRRLLQLALGITLIFLTVTL